jgi:tripartite-type tricarboxylate transporter receptor subunit TctC
MRRHGVGLVLAAFMVLGILPAAAWPDGPVRIVVPYAAGGSTDVFARVVAARLQARLGQPVVIENISGGAGNNGSAIVAKSAANGNTLLMATPGPAAMNQFMYRRMPFDTATAFTPIAYVAYFPSVLVVGPKIKATTVKDFVAEMRSLPDGANFGSAGMGSTGHLGGTLFVSKVGMKGTHIPYRGSAPMLQDLLGGNIHFTVDTVPGVMSFITSGTLRALAITGNTRAPAIPDVPNNVEAGIPDVEMSSWLALMGPAGTPREVVDRVNAEVNATIREPAMIKRIEELGAVPTGGSPEDLAAFLRSETEKWKRIIETARISIE